MPVSGAARRACSVAGIEAELDIPAGPAARRSARSALSALAASVFDRRAWRRIAYLLLAFPLGTAYFCILVTGLSTGLGIAIITLGLPVVVLIAMWRAIARFERWLTGSMLEVDLPSPYRPAPETGWFARLLARLADPATWKDLIYLMVDFPLGLIDFTVAVVLVAVPLWLIGAPAYYWAVPDGIQLGLIQVDTLPEAIAAAAAGLVLLPLGVRAASLFAGVHAAFARIMLTADPDPELSARVVDLRSSQMRLLAAADAERRRLERDLHDGAQQRLVAVALQLRMARDRLARGEDSLALVTEAGEEAQRAIAELRDLARGIHPAVLTERGLAAALTDVAARAPVPVEIVDAPDERFAPPVESTAYFVVSEALANVAKYAQASYVTVSARCEDDLLVVEVSDDGVGGADPEAGSGLRGLLDRVAALEGELTIESPPGGGTRVRAAVPAGVAADDEPAPGPAAAAEPRVLDERAAAIVRLRRRRLLATHAAVFAIVQLALVIIWLATGAGYFWPGWAIFGWGVVLALHASLAIVRAPISESAVSREQAAGG